MPTEGGAAVPVPESELVLRPAEPDDADALALIHVLARRAAPMPDPVHPDDDVRRWLRERVVEAANGIGKTVTRLQEGDNVPREIMRRALDLATDPSIRPGANPRVGCVLLDESGEPGRRRLRERR